MSLSRSRTGSTATGITSPIGQTTGTTFGDTGLVVGSTHTYAVDAVDAATNPSQLSASSAPITVFTPDATPPTTPGQPSGTSTSRAGSI